MPQSTETDQISLAKTGSPVETTVKTAAEPNIDSAYEELGGIIIPETDNDTPLCSNLGSSLAAEATINEILPSKNSPENNATRFLSFLAFEGHGLRVGLELSACVFLYILLSVTIPWPAFGLNPGIGALVSWLLSCALVVCFDQCFICHPAHLYRRSYLLALHGSYDSALKLLDLIGPASQSMVKLPPAMYHTLRAEVLMQSEQYPQAEREIILAESNGADAIRLFITRSRLLRLRGDIEAAEAELHCAQTIFGEAPTLRLEQGIQLLEDRKQLWDAKRLFHSLMEDSSSTHYSGERSSELARAYYHAARLWTGEAEEGLEGLTRAIEYLRGAAIYADTLRPFLAQLLLERSHYQATHKEPQAALIDLRVAMSLCSYQSLMTHAEKIKEELRWRHSLELT